MKQLLDCFCDTQNNRGQFFQHLLQLTVCFIHVQYSHFTTQLEAVDIRCPSKS